MAVEAGQVWLGSTGNRLVIREVKDGRARLSYEDGPGDETWEDVADVESAFTLAALRKPLLVDGVNQDRTGAVLEQWLAEGTE